MSEVKKLWSAWVNQEEENLQNKNSVRSLKNIDISYDASESKITISSNKKTTLNLIKHNKEEIEDFFSLRLNKRVSLEFLPQLSDVVIKDKQKNKEIKVKSLGLFIQYSFKNFIVGDPNKEAFLAFKKFAETGNSFFSPLFLHGGNGLGKTHLVNAAGNDLVSRGFSVACLTSTKIFELLNEQRFNKNRTERLFQEELKDYDVVIIDDIQLFEGKEAGLLVLFDIIDFFINKRKRVAIVSDQKPQELPFFSERLKSRLSSGLLIKIKSLDLQTAIKIVQLKLKINPSELKLSNEIVHFIAQNFGSDVRLIESAIKRIDFLSLTIFDESKITLDFVKSSLKDMMKDKSKSTLANTIIEVVARNYSIPMDSIISPSRKKIHTGPRHVSMYLIRKLTSLSFGQIGGLFGGKDQSTISSACEKVDNAIKEDKKYNEKIKFIEETIGKMFSKE